MRSRSLPQFRAGAGAVARRERADAEALEGMRALSRVLDDAIPIPGTRFRIGLDALLGLIPWAGDVTGAAASGYALLTAARVGAPAPVILRMVMNIGLDMLIGAIPLLGDLFDFGWKANRKNLALLETYVQQPQQTRKASRGVLVFAVLALLALIGGGIWLAVYVLRAIGEKIFG